MPMLTRETDVPQLDHPSEARLVERLAQQEYDRILIVSDLHMVTGRDRDTGVFQMTENFYADDTFQSCLQHYGGNNSLLILNGDIFDFVRIGDYPRQPIDFTRWETRLSELRDPRAAALPENISRVERTYGLKTDDYKTLWKLIRIVDGHPQFFDALAAWLSSGGSILYVKGNHDVEQHWPLIRRALRDEVVQRGASLVDATKRFGFVEDYVIIGNVYVEHGHKYEDMTAVYGPPVLEKSTQINMPLGSFINRYCVNKIEMLDPFIDNIKPVQQALLALLRRHPIAMLGTYIRACRFIRRAIWDMKRFNGSVATILLGVSLPFLLPLILIGVPSIWQWVQRVLPFERTGDIIAGGLSGTIATALMPYVLGAFTEILRRFKKPRDHIAEGAVTAIRTKFDGTAKRYYAVFGHTHVQLVKRLAIQGCDALYINTGTWIALWPNDRRDLIGQVHYSYAEFVPAGQGEYRHKSQEWDEHASEPRSARILVSANA